MRREAAHVVEFDIDGNGLGTVKLGGQEIRCFGFSFEGDAQKPAAVTLRMFAEVKGKIVTNNLLGVIHKEQ
jgi:hypothetical protein